MATTYPYAYNTGSTISGTSQQGNIAIGTGTTIDYSLNPGGVTWYMGPDEDLGYLIAAPKSGLGRPEFWRSSGFTDEGFLNIANCVSRKLNGPILTDVDGVYSWLNETLSGGTTTFDPPTP